MLARARHDGTFPSALLLHGDRGVGKQRLALWSAQLLLCAAPAHEPCGRCHPCRLALGLQHPDLHWHFPLTRPKGASGDRLGDALEQERGRVLQERRADPIGGGRPEEPAGIYLAAVQMLRRRAQTRPAMGDEQVFVVGDAEALVSQEASPEAANALLKLLEEPPAGTRLILTSSEPGRLLPTVRSRTVPLHMGRLPRDLVQRFLREEAGVDEAAAEAAARLADGSIGRALGFLPREDRPGELDELRMRALELLRVALSPRRQEAFALALSFSPTGARALAELLDFVDAAVRDLAALAAEAPERTVSPDAATLLRRSLLDRPVDPADAARGLAVVERYRELARGNVNPQLLITGLVEDLRRTLTRRARTAGVSSS